MKAAITNNTKNPRGFFIDGKQVVVQIGETIEGNYDDRLLQALKNTGFDVKHEGKLKVATGKTTADTKQIADDAKAEADKIVIDAMAEAEKIIAEAKAEAEKLSAEKPVDEAKKA